MKAVLVWCLGATLAAAAGAGAHARAPTAFPEPQGLLAAEPRVEEGPGLDREDDGLRRLLATLRGPAAQSTRDGGPIGFGIEAGGGALGSIPAGAQGTEGGGVAAPRRRRLPFLGEKAREAGYELPLPLGAGLVGYFLDRDIRIDEVRLGRNGAALAPVGDFVHLGSDSTVENLNVKVDAWLLPFLDVYAIAGYIRNESDTTVEVTLPPLLPGGAPRRRSVTVPTALEGSVGGLGVTLAGGYRAFFAAADVNAARADLGFDDTFEAVVSSLRAGWNGEVAARPTRIWANATYWDTFATAKGSVADPDGGTLRFEVDQGPSHAWTYGLGFQVSVRPWFEFAADSGADFHGGWYVALVPTFRF